MNYIVSSLFTTCVDPLRNIRWSPSLGIMDKWYRSGEKVCAENKDIQLLVFYDQLDENILSKYSSEFITFIQVEECGEHSPHDYRWIVYNAFLENNIESVDNVFFTDISDVLIKQNPFLNIEKDVLYTGDENQLWENEWAAPRNEYYLEYLPSFKEVYEKNKLSSFLNAGILGGNSKIVLEFLNKITHYISITLNKPYETSDMIIFNYVVYKYFPNKKHGFPVNSNFWKYEINRNDVWFVHK